MAKKRRVGSNPLKEEHLSFIQDTRDKNQPSKQSNQGIQDINLTKRKRREITKSSQEGCAIGWTRATFIVDEEKLQHLKQAAYWERKQLKDIVDECLNSYLQGKTYKPIPDEKTGGK